MTFGKQLKQARLNLDLTQKQISDKLGWTSSQMISEVERGSVYLSPESLKKVCKILNLDYKETLKTMVCEKYGINI
jgi:transcriptional regulator with XRE-family HTH domain